MIITSFKTHFLIEHMKKNDIIDLYLIMAIPISIEKLPKDMQFTINEIIKNSTTS